MPSRSPGRPLDEEKDCAILEAAHELFLSKGFAATGMQEVAKKAGVSKVTLYKRFPDKLALFRGSVCCAKSKMEQRLNPSHCRKQSLQSTLTSYGVEILSFMMRHEYIAFERLLAQQAAKNPALAKEFFQSGAEHCKQRLAELISLHSNMKSKRKAADAAEILLSLWLGYRWGAVRLSAMPPLHGRELKAHVVRGIRVMLQYLES